jgi:hypothetical protein
MSWSLTPASSVGASSRPGDSGCSMTMHHHQQLLLMLPRSARPSMAAWRVRRPCQLHSARHGVCAGQAGGQGLTLACQRLASLHANGQRRRPAPTASADGQRRRPAPTASADPAAGGGGWLGGLTGAPPLLDHWNAAATAAAASAAAALSVMASRRRAAALRAGAGVRGWALPLERRAAGLPPQRGARPGEQTRRPAQLTKTLALSTDKRRPAPTASFVGQLCGPITLTTRSLQPLVFLVEPLLTHAECAHVINITTPMLVDSDVTLFDSDRTPPPPPMLP